MASSIGKLNVQIGASATEFNATIATVEKKVAGFAAKMMSPMTGLAAGFGGIGGMAMAGLIDPLSQMAKMLPGGELAATAVGLANLDKSVDDTVDRMKQLNSQSKRLGIAPEFLRGLQLAAGPDADMVAQAMGKFEKFLGQLRVGQDDVGRATTGLTAKIGRFVDINELVKSKDMPSAIRKFADAFKNIHDPVDRATLLFSAFGRSGLGMTKMLEAGAEGIDKNVEKVTKLGLVTKEGMESALAIAGMRKKHKLALESAELKATSGAGLFKEAAALEWQEGNMANWFGLKMNQWFSFMASPRNMEGLRKKFVEAGRQDANQQFEKARSDAIENLIMSLEKEAATLGMTRVELAAYNAEQMMATKQEKDRAVNAAMAVQTKAFDQATSALERQSKTFGMTAEQAMRYNAELEKIPEKNIAARAAVMQQMEVQQLFQQAMTPGEKYAKELDRMNQLGGLPDDVFVKAANQAFTRNFPIQSAIDQARNNLRQQNARPGLAERGSVQAAEFMADLQNSGTTQADNLKAIVDEAKRLLEEQQKNNRQNDEIIRELRRNPDVGKVLGIPP